MNKNSCLVININHFIISKMFVIYFINGSKTPLLPNSPFFIFENMIIANLNPS